MAAMKNILIFVTVFLSFLINASSSDGKVVVPSATIRIVAKTDGVDDSFKYYLDTYYDHVLSEEGRREVQLLTGNGVGETEVSLNVWGKIELRLNSVLPPGWQSLGPSCTSTDSSEIFSVTNGDVGFIIHPNSIITCTFIYKQKITPVLIVPGVLSSYLNKTDAAKTELWPNIWTALFGWPGDKYLDYLSLNQIGQPNLSSPVVATDIFRNIVKVDFFEGLISRLETAGYDEGQSLFTFPYDWRRDIRENTLSEKINQILQQTSADKINIIAHSMGGLLVKHYIKHNGTSTVDKFIDIATPHLGAPSAFKTLTYGDDMGIKFGIFGLNSSEVKSISQNMPSIYQLLPSRNYFSTTSPDYKYYLYDMDNVDGNGVRGRLDFDQTKQLLVSSGRNNVLLDAAPNIHNDLDFMNPGDFGVEAYNIVGCGVPTVGKFFLLGHKNNQGNYYDVSYISGDGTVPEKSARSFPAVREYQIGGIRHSALPSATDTDSIINDILLNKNIATSTSSPDCKLPDGDLLSFHGPVKVDVYDKDNNHAGPIIGSGFEQSIPEITYDFIDNNTFVYLPLMNEYSVEISGIRRGTVSSHIKKMVNEQIVSTTYYHDIPIENASTTFQIRLPNTEIILSGQIVPSSATSSVDTLIDLEPPITSASAIPSATTTKVIFSSTDADILQTEYSTDDGQNFLAASSTLPLVISTIGTTTIIYQSIDTSGNLETPRQIDIYLATTSAISLSTSTVAEVVSSPPAVTSDVRHVSKKRRSIDSVDNVKDTTEEGESSLISTTSIALATEILIATNSVTENIKNEVPKVESIAVPVVSNLSYASVVEAETEAVNFYKWGTILFLLFILLLIIFHQKRRRRVKYYHDK